MKCPKCQAQMKETVSQKGVALDICTHCRGLWLDEGELRFYSQKTQSSFKPQEELNILCPRCEKNLQRGRLDSVEVEQCPSCKGFYFDKGELLKLTQDEALTEQRLVEKRRAFLSARLPSLGLVSLTVISGLYALLFAVLIGVSSLGFLDVNLIMPIMVGVIVINFFVAPFFTDLFLRYLGSLTWVEARELPPHLASFLKSACQKNKIPLPRIGLVSDDAPNAFTYGRTPGSARLILTRGLLKILDEKELEAVVAHELGHIVHWDFLFMTLAQLVPMLLYEVYRFLQKSLKSKGRGNKKGGWPFLVLLIASYLAYRLAQYIVLYLSRVREYWADRFSGELTGNPNFLSRALIKIAYGLNNTEPSEEDKKMELEGKRKTVGAFGIADQDSSKAFALYAAQGAREGAQLSKESMQWDLWNPWATFFELHSTHPLTAKRISSLAVLSQTMGVEPDFVFDLRKPESYWDEFFLDVLMIFSPLLLALLGFLVRPGVPYTLLGFGLGFLLKTYYAYPREDAGRFSVSSLLKIVKVSGIRGIPVSLSGKVIGRGIPGYILSEDFVIQDKTGIIFLDYRQPLGIFDFFFGVFRRKSYEGQEVIVRGWYRRSPMPYIEIAEIRTAGGESSRCYSYAGQLFLAYALIFLSFIFPLVMRAF